jgi:hypothetical protein
MRSPPSTAHIDLDGIEPYKILKFYQDVVKLVHETNFIFKVQVCIKPNVTNLICAKYNLSFFEYYGKTFDDIMVYLSEIVRPVTSDEFTALMINNLKCEGTLEKKHFIPYYFSMLKYILDYTQLFKILAQNNKDNIPSVNNQKFGLIATFGYKIDKAYFNKVRSSMKHDKYTSIYLFLNEFKVIITKHYEHHKIYMSLPGGKGDNMINYGNNNLNTDINKAKNNNNIQYKKYSPKYSALNNVGMVDHDEDNLSDDDDDDDDDDLSIFQDYTQVTSNDEGNKDTLNIINTMGNQKKPAATADIPLCNNLLIYGKCLKDKDIKHQQMYSHDHNTLQRKSQELMERLKMRQTSA